MLKPKAITDNQRHREMVRRLKKDPTAIDASLGTSDIDQIHMALGLAGEAGEVVDLIKKRVINGNADPDFRTKLGLELGDVLFYIQGLLDNLDLSLDEVLRGNIMKLETRYGSGAYSDEQARRRVDTHLDQAMRDQEAIAEINAQIDYEERHALAPDFGEESPR